MGFGVLLLIIIFIALATLALIKGFKNEQYFAKSNLKWLKPSFFFGSSGGLFLNKVDIVSFTCEMYNRMPNEKVMAYFTLRSPTLMINDPVLAKHLLVKEFDHFVDHQKFISDAQDWMFGNFLFNLRGSKWRDMRATLSPALTGSKMRSMFQCIDIISERFVETLSEQVQWEHVFEMKKLCSTFMNDVIALSAFGFEVNSLKEPNNDFFAHGQQLNQITSPIVTLKFLGFLTCPKILEFLKIELFSDKIKNFFKDVVLQTMDYRSRNNIQRPDMISLLMQAKEGKLKLEVDSNLDSAGFATAVESEIGKKVIKRQWSDKELVAQCFGFFFGGFETSSTVSSMGAYELAMNPDIQDKLFAEVQQVNASLNGAKITYETMQKMKYLDQFVSELLRKWPPAPAVSRECGKDLAFDDGDGFKYHFKKGLILFVPLHGYHMNPKYFPDPQKFDPDRFADENKNQINCDAYMPFGIGPRNCIGSRMALMFVKMLLYNLVRHFSIHVVSRTEIPLTFKPGFAALSTKNGIWLGVKKRLPHRFGKIAINGSTI